MSQLRANRPIDYAARTRVHAVAHALELIMEIFDVFAHIPTASHARLDGAAMALTMTRSS